MKWIEGKKTYIGAVLTFVAGGLWALKIIDDKTLEFLVLTFGSFTALSMRHAISKQSEEIKRMNE